MPKIDHDTKEKVLIAAEKVFHNSGFKGARTTEIAQLAGISRTMLHYYFNSKEDLFKAVVDKTMGSVIQSTSSQVAEGKNLKEIIDNIIDHLALIFKQNPSLPTFVVNVINESPEIAYFVAKTLNDTLPKDLHQLIKAARYENNLAPHITGENIMIDIYALLSGPYLVTSYLKAQHNGEEAMFDFIIERRIQHVKDIIHNSMIATSQFVEESQPK
jgi:TetR/AcrR family transcriptional regulator